MKRMRTIPMGILVTLSLVLAGCTLPAPPGSGGSTTVADNTLAALSGRVWQDTCQRPAAGQTLTIAPQGCLPDGAGGFRPNGTVDSGEVGLSGVKVNLASGPCPAALISSMDTTAEGMYAFGDLTPGTYCVSIDSSENSGVLGTGGWTSPAVSPGGLIGATVDMQAGQVVSSVNFGWDRGVTTPSEAVPSPTPEPTQAPEATSTAEPTATTEASPTPGSSPTAQASASASVSPIPTLASGDPKAGLGTPSFHDTFQSGGNWPLYEDDHVKFEIADGKLTMTAFNADNRAGWMMPGKGVDSYIEFVAGTGTCSGLDQYGVVARMSGSDKGYIGYLYGITCDGRYSLRTWDGETMKRLVDWTPSAEILTGSNKVNRIGIKLDGTKISLYVNGKLLKEITSDAYDQGWFGVFIGAGSTANFAVTGTEFSAWELP
ncbi:MAG TPA: SdrD B-like domain-containing protein [Anaerolineales bacterium]|nr:SdrD B-like domain-containing protein [Anaerolineales bacterium]